MVVVGYITGGEAEAALRVSKFKSQHKHEIKEALELALIAPAGSWGVGSGGGNKSSGGGGNGRSDDSSDDDDGSGSDDDDDSSRRKQKKGLMDCFRKNRVSGGTGNEEKFSSPVKVGFGALKCCGA